MGPLVREAHAAIASAETAIRNCLFMVASLR
jgi:hypothetical protein